MKFRRCHTESVQVNITPLIDVVFLLLIFFMVTTTFLEQSHIKVNLPVADTKIEKTPQNIHIVITQSGDVFLNDQPVSNTTLLLSRLQYLGKQITHPNVVISADAKTTHQSVVTVMQTVGKAGLGRLSIQTIDSGSP